MSQNTRSLRALIQQIRSSGGSVEETFTQMIRSGNPLFGRIGLRLEKLGDGLAEISFPMSEEIKRRGGMVHGGIIMYVLDSVCGFAVMSLNEGQDQFTAELKVNFLEPLQKPPFRAVGRVVRMGGRLAVAEGEVLDGDGKICAKCLGTWYLVR